MADELDTGPVHLMALCLAKALSSMMATTGHGYVLILTLPTDDPAINDSACVTNLKGDSARLCLQQALDASTRVGMTHAAWNRPPKDVQ